MMTSDAINLHFGSLFLNKNFTCVCTKWTIWHAKSPKLCLHSSVPLGGALGRKYLSCREWSWSPPQYWNLNRERKLAPLGVAVASFVAWTKYSNWFTRRQHPKRPAYLLGPVHLFDSHSCSGFRWKRVDEHFLLLGWNICQHSNFNFSYSYHCFNLKNAAIIKSKVGCMCLCQRDAE